MNPLVTDKEAIDKCVWELIGTIQEAIVACSLKCYLVLMCSTLCLLLFRMKYA